MALPAFFLYIFFIDGVAVAAPTLLGVAVYFILAVLLRIGTVAQIKALLRRRKPS